MFSMGSDDILMKIKLKFYKTEIKHLIIYQIVTQSALIWHWKLPIEQAKQYISTWNGVISN